VVRLVHGHGSLRVAEHDLRGSGELERSSAGSPVAHVRKMVRVVLACVVSVLISGCVSEPGDESIVEALRANDVSILFPHPAAGEDDLLLGVAPTADHPGLLPEALYRRLGDAAFDLPRLVEAAGDSETYGRLRVTAARVDPCFDGSEPCIRQVRLVAQLLSPVDGGSGEVTLSDASIHLFYRLDDAAFVRLLVELHAVGPTEGPLTVHPRLADQGLGGPAAERVRSAIRDACSIANLTRFTFMATGRSKNWFFFILDRDATGDFTMSHITGMPEEVTGDGFEDHGLTGYRTGNPLGVPWFPDALTQTISTRALDEPAFAAGIDQLARLANPDLVRTGEVNCTSCHLVDTTRTEALRDRGLTDVPASPSQFSPMPPPTPRMGNLHAFSWFGGVPTVNARTANETQRVLDHLTSSAFLDSLAPELRAQLVPER
jgi:hypothetical protein